MALTSIKDMSPTFRRDLEYALERQAFAYKELIAASDGFREATSKLDEAEKRDASITNRNTFPAVRASEALVRAKVAFEESTARGIRAMLECDETSEIAANMQAEFRRLQGV
jgi:hypothetical protein